jgi:hypothetical protein
MGISYFPMKLKISLNVGFRKNSEKLPKLYIGF